MKITFLGDIMLDEQQLKLHRTEESYSFDGMIYPLNTCFGDSQYIIANLETPVTGSCKNLTASPAQFDSPKELLDTVRESGINIVSTANNHCLDRGVNGLKRTIKMIRKKRLINIGTHLKKNEDHYLILDDGEIRVGLLSLTYGTNAFLNNNYLDKNHEFMVDMLQDQELRNRLSRFFYHNNSKLFQVMKFILFRLHLFQWDTLVYERKYSSRKKLKAAKKYIEECKSKADYVIAYLHFGGQFNNEPTRLAEFYAQKCFEFGADAIVGNHEHLIQKIDNKKNFCAYSLGNFLSTQGVTGWPEDRMAEYSIAVTMDIRRDEPPKRWFSMFMNAVDDEGKNYNIPVYEYLKKKPDEKIEKNMNELINRVYNTKEIVYPIKEEYEV